MFVAFWVCLSITSGEKELPPGICQGHLVCSGQFLTIMESHLRWLGHLGRISDDRLPKQLLFGELQKTTLSWDQKAVV